MGVDPGMVKLMADMVSGKRGPNMMKQTGMDPNILERMVGLSKLAGLMGGIPSPRSSSPSRPSSGPTRRPRSSGGATAAVTSA
eukprot:6465712-Alexandrium_andersonii.AAC.1